MTVFFDNIADDAGVIIDSNMSREEAFRGLSAECPHGVVLQQQLVDVLYFSFDCQMHAGQIVVHEDVVEDVEGLFDVIIETRFPVCSAIPLSSDLFCWSDNKSMKANNTSGFNYRRVVFGDRLSRHATGRAIDINPVQNVYHGNGHVLPPNGSYDPDAPGTLTLESPVTQFLLSRGWRWGGQWDNPVDYQHFVKG